MPESPYLTAREALEYLRLGSMGALYHLIREQALPFCRVGRHYRFDRRELDAWLRGFPSALDQVRHERQTRRSA